MLTGLIPTLACREIESPPPMPLPVARPELVESLREDVTLERHPSDGGGRAWIEDASPTPIRAGERGRWHITYEAGDQGISVGGMIFLQVSPFWGWSTPQTLEPQRTGYTLVETDASGVTLEATTVDQQLLAIRIAGRRLEPGERVQIVYGAGEAGAVSDRFAEHDTHFWIAVDGDGDGVRGLIDSSPSIDVAPGAAARLVVLLPSTAQPGDRVQLLVVALDAQANSPVALEETFEIVAPTAIEAPKEVHLTAAGGGRSSVEVVVHEEGIFRIRAVGPGGLEAESNPLVVATEGLPILWGDLHGHSNFSDGTGTPEDYFRYARDVAALDFAALTDHDHWGMRALSQNPDMWSEIQHQVRAFHEPGTFVTLLGYEWTSWIHGHRHVLYFRDEGEVLSSVDPRFESPTQLWDALRGQEALTFAHHSAGGPISVDWNIPPDPVLEPVTEIVSVHGSSEAADSPGVIYSPVSGGFVRDALDYGHRLGFIGSGDSHDGHPGLAHLASPSGGLAAILSEDRSREAILEALRARRVYATNGPRIVLRAALDGRRMGSSLETTGSPSEILGFAVGEEPLSHVDLIRNGEIFVTISGDGSRFLSFEQSLPAFEAGGYMYVRAVQTDGGAAWSSPFFFEE